MPLLTFDREMLNFLSFAQRESIIAALFLQGDRSHIIEEGNFIKTEDDIDVISYLPVSKYEKVEDQWKNGRVKIKIGRFVRKFLTDFSIQNFRVDDAGIEKFVNIYKSYFSRDTSKLKIVEGDELLKYYLEENYHRENGRNGSLWNSCMRQSERNKFLEIYAKNPEKVKMLIFLSDDDKIRARALLWYNVQDHKNPNVVYNVMDRIYYYYDHDVNFFKDWAFQNGYLAKWTQSAKSSMQFDDGSGDVIHKSLFVILDNTDFRYYPYLDTFKFYKDNKSRFSNDEYYLHDYVLIQSDGRLQRQQDDDEDIEIPAFFDEDVD